MINGLCSIIIPTFNHGGFIERSISCALSQTYALKEVIVVDDGSTDDTEDRVKQFGDQIIYYKRINGGLGAARNTGLQLSKGEYIQFLDADDFISPDKIEKQVDAFLNDEKVSLVYSDCTIIGRDGTPIEYSVYKLTEDEKLLDVIIRMNLFPVHSPLVKRKAIDDAGLFDESRYALEDWDLWIRIVLKDHQFKYVPGKWVHYDHQGSRMTADNTFMFKGHRHFLNKIASHPFMIKHPKRGDFIYNRSLYLAHEAYNKKWWNVARYYFYKSLVAKPSQIGYSSLSMIAKSVINQFISLIKGTTVPVPEFERS